MGMIETRLGDGTYVCNRSEFLSRPLLWAIASSSSAETEELIEARRLIEVELAGLAAERATPEDLKRMGTLLDVMESGTDKLQEFMQADIDFHLAIGQAAHNSILMNALHLIRNLLQHWIGRALKVHGVAQRALDQHRAIFVAIAKQSSSGARTAMKNHLEDMASFLKASNEGEASEKRRA
jgi:GntR family transcriptional repressor for pyruvate dehydrogenase complex